MMSKVPDVTLFFWIIKVLAATVGETAASPLVVSVAGEDAASATRPRCWRVSGRPTSLFNITVRRLHSWLS